MSKQTSIEHFLANNTSHDIEDRISLTDSELRRIVRDYFNNDPNLLNITDTLIAQSNDALQKIKNGNVPALKNGNGLESLEVIVDLGGSMPSYLIRHFKPDVNSSVASQWDKDYWVAAQHTLENAIRCVGRIEVGHAEAIHIGTGFLVAPDLIMTNLHVLQEVADQLADNTWRFRTRTCIDFGREFKAVTSFNARELKQVVYCPLQDNKPVPGHAPLDIALILLGPGNTRPDTRPCLPIITDDHWLASKEDIYVIGYPGKPPGGAYTESLLEQLFRTTYGYKRLSPGFLIDPEDAIPGWTMAYNATTLGGNSGSLVIHKTRGSMAAGIHFGGRMIEPRQNYGHIIARALSARDVLTKRTLQEVLNEYQITI